MHYFAYGSNMNFAQMGDRCHGSRFIEKVFLEDFKFVYDGHSKKRNGAVGNIIEHNGEVVWGCLFEITEDDLKILDKCEGYHSNSYDRKEFKVQNEKGNTYIAIAYFRIGKEIGKPSQEYRQIVIQGATNCGLPRIYIDRYL
jgi:gamma-glutamylcyclotransferase (GGCT)/AIG2-like uncharacterized protein YtfP